MSYWVLHIADPHFGRSHFNNDDPKLIALHHSAEIKQQLGEHNLLQDPFDALVISGDFTFAYEERGFVAAAHFVTDLAPLVAPRHPHDAESARPIVLIPGNHDVDIGTTLPLGTGSLPVERDKVEARFRKFLHDLGPLIQQPNDFLSTTLRLETPGEPGLVLMGMNSCRVERSDAQGWGYVGLDQVHAIARSVLIGDKHGHKRARDGDMVVAITHHHLLPVWDMPLADLLHLPDQRKVSFTLDSASVLHALTDLGVAALLHGHTHVISPKHVVGYGNQGGESTMVFGSASLGLFHPTCTNHHIQVLEFDSKEIRVHDLTSPAARRNQTRLWQREPERKVAISRHWDRHTAQAALNRISNESSYKEACFDWARAISWARLRAYFDGHRWPSVLDEIHREVQQFPDARNVEKDRIHQLIQAMLFDHPPSYEDLSGLTLQECVLKRLP